MAAICRYLDNYWPLFEEARRRCQAHGSTTTFTQAEISALLGRSFRRLPDAFDVARFFTTFGYQAEVQICLADDNTGIFLRLPDVPVSQEILDTDVCQ